MKWTGDRNDWWDWGIILLVVAGGTILLWASVWLVHSHFAEPGGASSSAVSVAPAMRRAIGGNQASAREGCMVHCGLALHDLHLSGQRPRAQAQPTTDKNE